MEVDAHVRCDREPQRDQDQVLVYGKSKKHTWSAVKEGTEIKKN